MHSKMRGLAIGNATINDHSTSYYRKEVHWYNKDEALEIPFIPRTAMIRINDSISMTGLLSVCVGRC